MGNYKPVYGKKSLINYVCPRCNEKVCNGVGPSGMPTVTTMLNKLPSSHLFFESACQHDIDYHDQVGKHFGDNRFLKNMYNDVKKTPFLTRWFWYIQARRNYRFVDLFGEEAYEKGACECLED